jgi:glycosyltransferase involved in cell wall biosynthesis
MMSEAPTRQPRIMMISLAYPPRAFGVSMLAYRQMKALAAHYRRDIPTGDLPLAVCAPVFAGDKAHAEPIAGVKEYRFPGYTTPVLRVPRMALSVMAAVRHFRPEVIYCPQYRALGPVVYLISRLTGIPYITYFHGTEVVTEIGRPGRDWMVRAYARQASSNFANSGWTCNLVREKLLGGKGEVHEMPPPIEPEPFQLAQRHREEHRQNLIPGFSKLEPRPLIILSAGVLSRRKAHDLIASALGHLLKTKPRELPRILWLIAGEGSERGNIEWECAQQEIQLCSSLTEYGDASAAVSVCFLGLVPPSEIASIFAISDVFVMPSRDDPKSIESYGMVYIEAAAAGVPSIGTRVGGISSAIVDGKTGLLVPPDDPASLAQAIFQLLTDNDFRAQTGKAAMQRAVGELDPNRTILKLLQIIHKAIHR